MMYLFKKYIYILEVMYFGYLFEIGKVKIVFLNLFFLVKSEYKI
jgi:hypothetical protein